MRRRRAIAVHLGGGRERRVGKNNATKNTEHKLQSRPVPGWLRKQPQMRATGTLEKVKDLQKYRRHLRAIEINFPPEIRDAEAWVAATRYFWQQSGGIVLEMGGLDGNWGNSVARQLLGFGWARILAEASPLHWKKAALVSKDATYIGAAICNGDSVHYLMHSSYPTTNGIAEFMNPSHITRFFESIAVSLANQGVLSNVSVDWSRVRWLALDLPKGVSISQVPCVQLKDVFLTLQVAHINLFILDVEGAEIAVLESIDFKLVKFDAICVETKGRRDGFVEDVTTLLASKGYQFDFQKRRNSWFYRVGFVPRARPSRASQ